MKLDMKLDMMALKAEYVALSGHHMTVQEQYTTQGQAKMDREYFLLRILADHAKITAADYSYRVSEEVYEKRLHSEVQ